MSDLGAIRRRDDEKLCALCGEPSHRQDSGSRSPSPVACVNTLRARVADLIGEVVRKDAALREILESADSDPDMNGPDLLAYESWLRRIATEALEGGDTKAVT